MFGAASGLAGDPGDSTASSQPPGVETAVVSDLLAGYQDAQEDVYVGTVTEATLSQARSAKLPPEAAAAAATQEFAVTEVSPFVANYAHAGWVINDAFADSDVLDTNVSADGLTLTVNTLEFVMVSWTDEKTGLPGDSSYTDPRTLTFTRDTTDGAWTLRSDERSEKTDVAAIAEQDRKLTERVVRENPSLFASDGSSADAPPATDIEKATSGDSVVALATNSYQGSTLNVSYFAWYASYFTDPAHSWNSAYVHVTNDCANYVSQALAYGGWDRQPGAWVNRTHTDIWTEHLSFVAWGQADQSYTWVNVDNNLAYVKATGQYSGPWSIESNAGQGDLLYFDLNSNSQNYEHVMAVTGRANGDPVVNGQNTLRHNYLLSNLIALGGTGNIFYANYVG